jgi:y4mF family transcriptional regulator
MRELSKLATFVKQKRKQLKISQIELADKAGVGIHFVRDLEQNKRTLRMDKVNDVLILFGCELGPITINRE